MKLIPIKRGGCCPCFPSWMSIKNTLLSFNHQDGDTGCLKVSSSLADICLCELEPGRPLSRWSPGWRPRATEWGYVLPRGILYGCGRGRLSGLLGVVWAFSGAGTRAGLWRRYFHKVLHLPLENWSHALFTFFNTDTWHGTASGSLFIGGRCPSTHWVVQK